MRALMTLIVLAILGGVAWTALSGHNSYPSMAASSASGSTAASGAPHHSAAWIKQLTSLRDEAIANIGWIAGNAKGHTEWPTVKPYVGEDGTYYNFFLRLADPTQPADVEANSNLRLYNDNVAVGTKAGHNPAEEADRTKRTVQISTEIGALLKQ